MDILHNKNLDIKIETGNGLNILDIACIHNHIDLFKDLLGQKSLNLPLNKSDARGWTIAHFAAMVGNTIIFDSLIENKLEMVRTKDLKTMLHICCEYGHENLCKTILKNFGKMVHDKDSEKRNALYYAAKGGNLDVFREIEIFFKGHLCETTGDERTVLHIACINNRTGICEYICKNKSYKSIINCTGEFRGWTAAHYVALEERHDGTEETLIRTLVDGGINMKATTVDGPTVLGVACEHRNKRLINYLLNNHDTLLGVERDALKAAAKASNDGYIVARITEALENYQQKMSKEKVKNVVKLLGAKQGSEDNLVFIS